MVAAIVRMTLILVQIVKNRTTVFLYFDDMLVADGQELYYFG